MWLPSCGGAVNGGGCRVGPTWVATPKHLASELPPEISYCRVSNSVASAGPLTGTFCWRLMPWPLRSVSKRWPNLQVSGRVTRSCTALTSNVSLGIDSMQAEVTVGGSCSRPFGSLRATNRTSPCTPAMAVGSPCRGHTDQYSPSPAPLSMMVGGANGLRCPGAGQILGLFERSSASRNWVADPP